MSISRSNLKSAIDMVATISVLIAAAFVIAHYANLRGERGPAAARGVTEASDVVEFGTAPAMGSDVARVGMVVFSDFECAYCQTFTLEVLPTLKRRFVDTGKVRLAYKHFPLESIHKAARRAGELSACLGKAGGFWSAHDLLFLRLNGKETELAIGSIFSQSTVSADELQACADEYGRSVVDSDIQQGRRLRVSGTPTFFVGKLEGSVLKASHRIVGAQPAEAFEEIIRELMR